MVQWARGRNSQLWDQRSRSCKAEDRFGAVSEVSFSNQGILSPLGSSRFYSSRLNFTATVLKSGVTCMLIGFEDYSLIRFTLIICAFTYTLDIQIF